MTKKQHRNFVPCFSSDPIIWYTVSISAGPVRKNFAGPGASDVSFQWLWFPVRERSATTGLRSSKIRRSSWRKSGNRTGSVPVEPTAAYRPLSDGAVTRDHILESYFEQTVERCRNAMVYQRLRWRWNLGHPDALRWTLRVGCCQFAGAVKTWRHSAVVRSRPCEQSGYGPVGSAPASADHPPQHSVAEDGPVQEI